MKENSYLRRHETTKVDIDRDSDDGAGDWRFDTADGQLLDVTGYSYLIGDC